MKTLENSQLTLFPETELPLTLSAAGSPAKIYQSQENEPELAKARDRVFGLSAYDLLASYDPSSQSLRTSQTCFLDQAISPERGLAEYSQTWPQSGMMRNGTVYELPMLVPGMNGTEFGYLPTPLKNSGNGSPKNRYYGSNQYRSNYAEGLRNGPDDPLYPTPDFAERVMGFPIGWTECLASETP